MAKIIFDDEGFLEISKVIGRLIAVLVDTGVVERNQAVWILEPLEDRKERLNEQ